MTFNYLHYGILTTYSHTYFLMRKSFKGTDSEDSLLYVSEPISLEGLNNFSIYQYWLYILHQSTLDGFYSSPNASPNKGLKEIHFDKNGKYMLTDIKPDQIDFSEIFHKTSSNNLLLRERGACGSCISGSIYNHPNIVFKCMDIYKRKKALKVFENEVGVYKKLESIQGIIIPKFYGFFRLYGMLIIALEYCGTGIKIQDMQEYKEVAQKAVNSINHLGVQHNDLQPHDGMIYSNILKLDDKITIIDFHKSSYSETASDTI